MQLLGSVGLTYHGVDQVGDRVPFAADPNRLLVSPDHLDSQLRALKRLGFRFVGATALIGDDRPAERVAALTFDDGFAGWAEHALPVLARHQATATFYVCSGWYGGQHPDIDGVAGRLLDEPDLRRLRDAGMEVGSHALTHPDLTKLDDAELDRQLVVSKQAVEAAVGTPCRTFAYPFGIHDDRVIAATERAGYELAWAWQPGRWHRFSAPRLPAPARHGGRRLTLKLVGVRRFWAP